MSVSAVAIGLVTLASGTAEQVATEDEALGVV
jgi:hypothetical protein